MPVPVVTEATFEREVLQSELPVLIDLYADWCAPCRTLSPRVEEVAAENAGKLKVVKVNVDHSPRIAQMFQAKSIPMLVLIVQGQLAGSLQGAVPKHEIVDLVTPHLPGAADELPAGEVAKLLKARRVVIVDVREAPAFTRAHVPGALNIPLADLATKLGTMTIPRVPIVVYDRSAGDDAKSALKTFGELGIPAALLKGGFLGWEAEGLDIER